MYPLTAATAYYPPSAYNPTYTQPAYASSFALPQTPAITEQPPASPWYANRKWVFTLGALGILGVTAACLMGNWQRVIDKAQSWLSMFSRQETQTNLVESGVKAIKTEFKGINRLLGSKKGVQELVDQVVTKVTETLKPQLEAVTSLLTSTTKRRQLLKETADATVEAVESRLPKAIETSLKTAEDRYAQPATWRGKIFRWLLGINK